MASFLDKFSINTAITENTVMDLSCQHVTTSNFLSLSPVYIKEMVPGEKLEVHQESFVRMAPMPVPTFGRANVHNRAFFVPFRTIFRNWDTFITQSMTFKPDASGVIMNGSVPIIRNKDLVGVFLYNTLGVMVGTGNVSGNQFVRIADPGEESVDIAVDAISPTLSQGNVQHIYMYYKLTRVGKMALKILQSLGYQIIWQAAYGNYSYFDDTTLDQSIKNQWINSTYSALPLLAFVRIYLDWYTPSQYAETASAYLSLKKLLDSYELDSNSVNSNRLNLTNLRSILNVTYHVNYDSDYFVSAWDHPTMPSGSTVLGDGQLGFVDVNNISVYDKDSVNDQSSIVTKMISANIGDGDFPGIDMQNVSAVGGLSQYALDALKSLTDYFKRHQLVGSRALDRFYARFGKSLPAEKLNRSIYLGADNIPVQFGDVFSTANTDGARLGDYAGKGLAYGGNDKFEYSTDEYGLFIICSSIVPKVNYGIGQSRLVKHINPLDFWTPEFDNLGTQPIGKAEIGVPMGNEDTEVSKVSESPEDWNNKDLADGIFGFTPRYSEYKVGLDKLTGDFRLGIAEAGDTSDAWHLFRNPFVVYSAAESLVHMPEFVDGTDADQYNRIFYNTNSDTDKFYIIHNFDVTSNSPMKPLYDTYDFEEKGKKVVADVNGVKVN